VLQPHFCKSVRMTLTLPKWGFRSPPGLLKFQSSIAGVKTPRLEASFMSLQKVLKCRCRKWPRLSHLDVCSTSNGKKKGRESNLQFDSRPLKIGNWPNLKVHRWSATHRWKALKESYKFVSDLIPIEGLNKELWTHKIPGVQTRIILGFLGSPGTKSHLDVGAAE
jgi:hypothetical protein